MLTKNHLIYVMHNVICWERSYSPKTKSIKAIANACEKYDGEYSSYEYESLIRKIGLKNCLAEI